MTLLTETVVTNIRKWLFWCLL